LVDLIPPSFVCIGTPHRRSSPAIQMLLAYRPPPWISD
jgi:hypothetical protein